MQFSTLLCVLIMSAQVYGPSQPKKTTVKCAFVGGRAEWRARSWSVEVGSNGEAVKNYTTFPPFSIAEECHRETVELNRNQLESLYRTIRSQRFFDFRSRYHTNWSDTSKVSFEVSLEGQTHKVEVFNLLDEDMWDDRKKLITIWACILELVHSPNEASNGDTPQRWMKFIKEGPIR